MKRCAWLFLFLPFVLLIASCAIQPPVEATPTPTSSATAIPAPTPTSVYATMPGVYFGAFNADSAMEEALGSKFAVQMNYLAWGNRFGSSAAVPNADKGWVTMSTWEYKANFGGPTDPYIFQPLKSIVDGNQDEYLREFARDARAFGKPFLLRWGHEMNGDWYIWSGTKNGAASLDKYGDVTKPDGPELFVDAFRHIHTVFEEEGADNVIWVWCPNVVMTGKLGEAWNDIRNYYPGDEYVDWLCMDGYNWGTSQSWSSWQTFDQVFAPTYAQLQAINAEKPIMIGEFASSDKGGDKAAWVKDAFPRLLDAYPQIRLAIWFHINKETNWRMDSSPEALAAFREILTGSRWMNAWPGFEK